MAPMHPQHSGASCEVRHFLVLFLPLGAMRCMYIRAAVHLNLGELVERRTAGPSPSLSTLFHADHQGRPSQTPGAMLPVDFLYMFPSSSSA